MIACRPVTLPGGAFNACRTGITLLPWLALVLRTPWPADACLVLLVASALLGVERAPLVVLYGQTVERLVPSRPVVLDRNGMRFAHALGALLVGIACVLLRVAPTAGWIALFVVACAKTASALGHCSALRLWQCMASGGCCSFTRRRDA